MELIVGMNGIANIGGFLCTNDETLAEKAKYLVQNSICLPSSSHLKSSEVNKILEQQRADGKIGSNLEAEVELSLSSEWLDVLKLLGDELRFVFITSY